MLEVDSILKSFGTRQILTDIFLQCNKGEIIALIGRNGCGKSTLMRIICGFLPAQNKFVRVDGMLYNSVRFRVSPIHYLPQSNFLPSHIPVYKAIQLVCSKEGQYELFKHNIIKKLYRKKGNELSTGEKRMLEIFISVFSNAPYVLLDEPFNGVAPVHKLLIKELIIKASINKGFVITDHDYRNILDIATRKLLLKDGGLIEFTCDRDLVTHGYLTERAFM